MTEQDSSKRPPRLLFGFLLAMVLPVLVVTLLADSSGDGAIGTFKDNGDIFGQRYLAEDDDRHNDGPNENEATNSPTILGYTRSVRTESKHTCRNTNG